VQEAEWHRKEQADGSVAMAAAEEPSITAEEEAGQLAEEPSLEEILARFKGDDTLASYNCDGVISVMCDGFVLRGTLPTSGKAVALKLKEWPMDHPKITEMFRAIQQREVAFNQLLMEEDPMDEQSLCRFISHWEKTGERDGHTVMVFELLEGTWTDILKADGGILPGARNIRRLRRELRSVLSFLSFLERLEIIHGDIKPENVCFKTDPAEVTPLEHDPTHQLNFCSGRS